MQTIKLRTCVGKDGTLHLQLPKHLVNQELEVLVVYQPVEPVKTPKTPEELGYSPGFFEEVAGGWAGEPLVRTDQGEYETREELI